MIPPPPKGKSSDRTAEAEPAGAEEDKMSLPIHTVAEMKGELSKPAMENLRELQVFPPSREEKRSQI